MPLPLLGLALTCASYSGQGEEQTDDYHYAHCRGDEVIDGAGQVRPSRGGYAGGKLLHQYNGETADNGTD